MYTQGIDVSSHQDDPNTAQRIDWTRPAAYGTRFVIHRALFVDQVDRDYRHNMTTMHGRYTRGAYAFWGYWPGCASTEIQARRMVDTLKPDLPEMPVIWMDYEKANSNYPALPSRAASLPHIERWMKTVEDGTGRETGIYTNIAGLFNLHPLPFWLRGKPLWLAWPLTPSTGETPEAFIQRTGITPPLKDYHPGWTIWQYSWKGPAKLYGMESGGLDMNYFNGDAAAFAAWVGNIPPAPPEPEPEPVTLTVLANALNVRTGPGTSYTAKDILPKGAIAEVLEVETDAAGNTWARINRPEWVAVKHNGATLARLD